MLKSSKFSFKVSKSFCMNAQKTNQVSTCPSLSEMVKDMRYATLVCVVTKTAFFRNKGYFNKMKN